MTDDFRDPKEILDPWDRLTRITHRLDKAMAHPNPHQFDVINSTLATCLLEMKQQLELVGSIADWSKDQIVAARAKAKA